MDSMVSDNPFYGSLSRGHSESFRPPPVTLGKRSAAPSLSQISQILERPSKITKSESTSKARPPNNASELIRQLSIRSGLYFVGLDLDECSVLGSDTNDILTICNEARKQVMSTPTTPGLNRLQAQEEIKQRLQMTDQIIADISQLVVNPELVAAHKSIMSKVKHVPYYFAYTNKSVVAKSILESYEYMRELRHHCLQSPAEVGSDIHESVKNSMHANSLDAKIIQASNGDTLYFEGSNPGESFDYLWKQYNACATFWNAIALQLGKSPVVDPSLLANQKTDLIKVGLATWGMSKSLGLNYLMPVFISSVRYKSLKLVMNTLGLDRENPAHFQKIFLFDDRAETHWINMVKDQDKPHYELIDGSKEPTLKETHMIPIQPYTGKIILSELRAMISKKLNTLIPNPVDYFARATPGHLRDISRPSITWPLDRLQYFNRARSLTGEGGLFRMGAGFMPYTSPSGLRRGNVWPTDMFDHANFSRVHEVAPRALSY